MVVRKSIVRSLHGEGANTRRVDGTRTPSHAGAVASAREGVATATQLEIGAGKTRSRRRAIGLSETGHVNERVMSSVVEY